MRFSILILLVVILTIGNSNAIVDKLVKKVPIVGKVVSAVSCEATKLLKTLNGDALHKIVDQFCETAGNLGSLGAKGFGFVQCDKEHKDDKTNKYCNDVGNAQTVFNMICCVVNEKRYEIFDKAIDCFKLNCEDKTGEKGQCCIKGWHQWFNEQKDLVEAAAKMG